MASTRKASISFYDGFLQGFFSFSGVVAQKGLLSKFYKASISALSALYRVRNYQRFGLRSFRG